MRVSRLLLACLAGASLISLGRSQHADELRRFSIPTTWDKTAIDSLELPLADPGVRPVHVSAEYYYKLPVRRFYKSYPVYHPSKEPKPDGKDYLEWLNEQSAVEILHDFSALKTQADWLAHGPALGQEVFDAPIGDAQSSPEFLGIVRLEDVRNPEWYQKVGVRYDDSGLVPFVRYVVTPQGVRLGTFSCAMCHTRVQELPDGKKVVIRGAQGNFPFDRVIAFIARVAAAAVGDEQKALEVDTLVTRMLYAAPWLQQDPLEPYLRLSLAERIALFDALPPGVLMRHGTSPLCPVQVPDLIGVKHRRYLDRTGLVRHRNQGDLMRYAALNQGIDFLNQYGDFIPLGKDFKVLPDVAAPPAELGGGRYSDEQLYALALYLYLLTPPPNPHPFDDLAARGKDVFAREDCARCHDPQQGYTSNMLVAAPGFEVLDDHPERENIFDESVDTDATLTITTRRGTGLYKVPSLLGVWYRGPLEHNGSVATLEDWFDRRRLRGDYVPTGWRGPLGTRARAVKGHEFGLELTQEDRAALIAFLKTL
jgi:hypothetical protein